MLDPKAYEGREQTYIKHFVLQRYLQKLAYKVGSWCPTLNYVDCFAGPWKHENEDLSDTSPFIAIRELGEVQQDWQSRDRSFEARCLFIEKNQASHRLLSAKISEQDRIEARALRGRFEDRVDEIVRFCDQAQKKHFDFFFIDPTGWKGFPLDVIGPLIRRSNCEVLINFMTQHISRFVDAENLSKADQENFRRLFGSDEAREKWHGLEGPARERRIIETYAEQVAEVGGFEYIVTSIVLHPLKNRTHFHLIYATRHPEGLRVFRNDAERRAIEEQNQTRFEAQERHQTSITGQLSLLDKSPVPTYLDDLVNAAIREMDALLRGRLREARDSILFDDLELEALRIPLVYTQRVKDWLKEKKREGRVEFLNMGKSRVPQAKKGHRIRWIGP